MQTSHTSRKLFNEIKPNKIYFIMQRFFLNTTSKSLKSDITVKTTDWFLFIALTFSTKGYQMAQNFAAF